MSSGHIIVALKRTLTVDSLMVAQIRISTAYNITVDDVRRGVLKPPKSNVLVKVVCKELNSRYLNLIERKMHLRTCTCMRLSNHRVFLYHHPMHQISKVLVLDFS